MIDFQSIYSAFFNLCCSDVDITGEIAKSAKSALKKEEEKPSDNTIQPTATGRVSVTFAGNTAFDREKTGNTTFYLTHVVRPRVIMGFVHVVM